jgi:hypothetical protein
MKFAKSIFFGILDTILRKKSPRANRFQMLGLIYTVNFNLMVFLAKKVVFVEKLLLKLQKTRRMTQPNFFNVKISITFEFQHGNVF